ncbi:hypothetical protein Aph01nite_68480 [Acrocarpospora phusangensis]|uniref:Uncharacterized protein n=1 Tax=Acrocarpospora phusangensis TaxID=1070424 RepID=A0A919QGT7_9ACTN|nr:hypothetical protein [Acrocarpospora phusangensis]GIH28538.1 hypothetical protein Aph01nite_68480 [Acrocarpospora phusangensis]
MRYVVVERRGRGTYWHDPDLYLAVLPTLRDALPPGAWAFAADPDHYDFSAPNCVKDLVLRTVPPTTSPPLDLGLRFDRGPIPDFNGLTISYTGVTSVEVTTEDDQPFEPSAFNSLRLDEILPAPGGCTHELTFTTATIKITAADLRVSWDPSTSD